MVLGETTGTRKKQTIQTKINELDMEYQKQREEWRREFMLSHPDGYLMVECAMQKMDMTTGPGRNPPLGLSYYIYPLMTRYCMG